MESNKKYFIRIIKQMRNFDLTDSVLNYKRNTGKCFIEEFWPETYNAFLEGRILERALMQEKVEELEKTRVDPCPHCQCSELLCGHPDNCTSGGE